jgi:hypothetical protein
MQIGSVNLAICPPELAAIDPNAETLWPKLLRKVGVTISKGEHIEERRAWTLRNFGLPSLLQRLRPGMTERERARVWWREAIACSEGESEIPNLSEENIYYLNPFIVTPAEKYPDPRASRLAEVQRGRPVKSDEEKRETNAARQRRFRANRPSEIACPQVAA